MSEPESTGPEGLTHLDARGDARMVDVGGKDVTEREAVARGSVRMQPETFARLVAGDTPKGDVMACARIAGIQAAKKTAELIPLCHVLPLSGCRVTLTPVEATSSVEIEARVRVVGRTGVEMEALTAVSVAALTLYDMLKAIDRDMVIDGVRVMEKRGGRRGEYVRSE